MKRQLTAITSIFLVFCMLFTAFPVAAANVDNAENSASVDDNMKIQSTNSVGAMIADAVGEEENRQENNNGVNVLSVEMDGKTATAEIETTRNATLIVGIYSEDGMEMYASGTTDITPDDETVQVTIAIDTMPQYFYVKAYIVDTQTLKPLCTVYNCPNYTQEMQEFFAKTVNDFEQDRVLNLDDSAANNFAIYNDDVKRIESTADSANKLVSSNDETKVYVIENADEAITSLQVGDIFSYDNGETIIIVKVKTISVDGTTATIEGEEIELEDVFDYVKIDRTADLSDAEYDPSGKDEDVSLVEDEPEAKGGDAVGAVEAGGTASRPFKSWRIKHFRKGLHAIIIGCRDGHALSNRRTKIDGNGG